MLKTVITRRRLVQLLIGGAVYLAVFVYGFSLLTLFLIALLLGALLGKTFCRWMCPLGFIMETLTTLRGKDTSQLGMYNYHKMGCPIAWVQGFLNRHSFLKIHVDPQTCTHCNICDSTCYIATFDKDFSLHKAKKARPGESFRCSKCLQCVANCPTGSLTLKAKA